MPDISSVIRDAATANGVDPAILAQIAQVESGGDPNAAASGSSAKGLFQVTAPTWRDMNGGDNPLDPVQNANVGARVTKRNLDGLTSAGFDPTPGNIYLAHFSGLGGAKSVLGADPSAPAGNVLGPAAVAANPFLKGMTVADLRSWADRKMGGASASAAPAAQPRAPQGGILNQGDQTATAQPGVLNTPEESPGVAFQNKLAELAAQRQPAPVPQLAPIQMAMPRGLSRARLLAALNQPLGA